MTPTPIIDGTVIPAPTGVAHYIGAYKHSPDSPWQFAYSVDAARTPEEAAGHAKAYACGSQSVIVVVKVELPI